MQLILNRIHCKKCNTDVISRNRYDMVGCGCTNQTCADGGTDYMKVSAIDMKMVEFTPVYIEDGVDKYRHAKIFRRNKLQKMKTEYIYVSAAELPTEIIELKIEEFEIDKNNSNTPSPYLTVLEEELKYRVMLERDKKINKIIE